MLIDVLHKDMIELDFSASSWEEAVREAGQLLVNDGCCGQEYIEEMVRTVKKMGAYIVISEGIALPHASGEHSYKVGISLLRLQKPVAFGHPENDPVDIVFGLAVFDSQAYLDTMTDFTKLLSNPRNVDIIRAAKTVDDVCDLLMSLEKNGEKTDG